ncbi:VanZ family protein [Sporosarcina sp. P13]|uniref:VanZ family protein n=1 Tax=Sporosarcina sp. P13 TaxID=2048263 RepID=UPI000C16EAD9|nr:VanZ family protein [Sporosarcina sp. P13]PIC64002.1 VanZ family protein [Sporosarcina sp. P13]
MKKLLGMLLVVGIIASLFISSSQTYEEQSLIPTLQDVLPNKPFEAILSTLSISYWERTISVEERGYYHFIEFLLRKSAHFVLFGLLAAGIFIALPSRIPRFFLAAFITLLLAFADELHQYFTGGRTATIRDVVLDMSGALTFLLIVQVISWIRSRKKNGYPKG